MVQKLDNPSGENSFFFFFKLKDVSHNTFYEPKKVNLTVWNCAPHAKCVVTICLGKLRIVTYLKFFKFLKIRNSLRNFD